MKKWLTMCWGGGHSSSTSNNSRISKADLDKAREKEMLLLEDSEDEGMGEDAPVIQRKKAAYVPQHAATSFMRTATSRRMRKANEVL
jgi:hypothetical protein